MVGIARLAEPDRAASLPEEVHQRPILPDQPFVDAAAHENPSWKVAGSLPQTIDEIGDPGEQRIALPQHASIKDERAREQDEAADHAGMVPGDRERCDGTKAGPDQHHAPRVLAQGQARPQGWEKILGDEVFVPRTARVLRNTIMRLREHRDHRRDVAAMDEVVQNGR